MLGPEVLTSSGVLPDDRDFISFTWNETTFGNTSEAYRNGFSGALAVGNRFVLCRYGLGCVAVDVSSRFFGSLMVRFLELGAMSLAEKTRTGIAGELVESARQAMP